MSTQLESEFWNYKSMFPWKWIQRNRPKMLKSDASAEGHLKVPQLHFWKIIFFWPYLKYYNNLRITKRSFFWVVLKGFILQFVRLCDLWSIVSFLESWIERCLNESESKRYSSHTSLGNMSNDERKQAPNLLTSPLFKIMYQSYS